MKIFTAATLLMITIKGLQMCIWFGIGVIIYNEILKGNIGLQIQERIYILNFILLTIIIFILICLIIFILSLNYFCDIEPLVYNPTIYDLGDNTDISVIDIIKTEDTISKSSIENVTISNENNLEEFYRKIEKAIKYRAKALII